MSNFASPTIDNIKHANLEIVKPKHLDLSSRNSAIAKELIEQLELIPHQEGGYFKETDRSPFHLQNPYNDEIANSGNLISTTDSNIGDKELTRNYSTLIYYLIAHEIPLGRLHRNRSRIIHILQRGSGQYVLIYPNGEIKTFRVGFNFAKGEVAQWVVPGDVWKASFLSDQDDHLLISEVVVPGFEFLDHKFMNNEKELAGLIGEEKARDLSWLLGK